MEDRLPLTLLCENRERVRITMTPQEATATIQAWIQTYSLFTAEAVSVTPAENGAWEVLVECSDLIWKQKVSSTGEVSAPVWVD